MIPREVREIPRDAKGVPQWQLVVVAAERSAFRGVSRRRAQGVLRNADDHARHGARACGAFPQLKWEQ